MLLIYTNTYIQQKIKRDICICLLQILFRRNKANDNTITRYSYRKYKSAYWIKQNDILKDMKILRKREVLDNKFIPCIEYQIKDPSCLNVFIVWYKCKMSGVLRKRIGVRYACVIRGKFQFHCTISAIVAR